MSAVKLGSMFTHPVTRSAKLRLTPSRRGLALGLLLLGLGSSVLAQADISAECQIIATSEVADLYVGPAGSDCADLLVISQTVFDAVGSTARSAVTSEPNGDGSFSVEFNGKTYVVDDWYTGNITNMAGYFYTTEIGDGTDTDPIGNISGWDTSSVVDMSSMFREGLYFNQYLNDWDVSQVTDMSTMFHANHDFNQDLNNWDVSRVTNMESMFSRTSEFNGNISTWNVSQVTNMKYMFVQALAFNQDLNGWDVSQVTTMFEMFKHTGVFNKDISNWNVSQVTDMYGMFRDASAFTQDLSSWDVSQVTVMTYMFHGAKGFNGALDWGDKTRNVESMAFMFEEASEFQGRGLTDWDTSRVTRMEAMFAGASNFIEDLGNWDVSNVDNMRDMFDGASLFDHDIGGWDVRNVAGMYNMFRNASKFDGDIGGWNVSSVRTMYSMFEGASSFNQDLSNWPVGYFTAAPHDFNTNANEAWRNDSSMQPNWAGTDTTNPVLETLYPKSGEGGVDPNVVLLLTFDEGITGGSGTIEIFDRNGSLFETINVSDSAADFEGARLFVTPPNAFTPGETYYVKISEGAIVDNSQQDNSFAGIDDDQTWRFSIYAEVDASKSTVAVDPANAAVDLTSSAIVRVTLVDPNDNLISGQEGELSAAVSNGAQLGDFAETASGVYEATLTSTQAGTTDVTVTVAGATLSPTVSVTFVEPIVLSASTASLEIVEGSTGAFTLSLASQPSVAVEVRATSSNTAAMSLSVDGGVTVGETAILIFEPSDWAPQTVSVTGLVNNAENEDVGISFGLKTWSETTQSYEEADPALMSVTVPDDITVTITAAQPPGAPTGVTATPGDQSLTLAWTAPDDDGGSVLTGYSYSLDGGTSYTAMIANDVTTSGDMHTYAITGSDAVPINGAALSVSLKAENRVGPGDPSAPAVTVPSVTLAAGGDEPVSAAFAVTATFSADVTGLGADDLGLENGMLSGSLSWSETDVAKVYSFEVQPDDALEGQVTVNMAAGAATLASDGVTGNTQALTLTVAVDTKGPVFTSGNSFTVSENSSSVGTLTATDGSGGVDYAITGGVDAGDFVIDASTGELSFDIDGAAADFESPADDDQDNDYQLEVTATDGTGNATAQAVTVTVANVVEAAALAVEAAGLDLLLETSALNLDEGQSGEVVLTLLEQPTDRVTLLVEVDDPDAAQILVSQDGATTTAQTTELIFELASWDTPQSLWIEAVDRTTALDPISTEVSLSFANSTDTGYQVLEASSFTVNAANTTAPSLEVSVKELTVGEGDSQDFKVVLNAQPTGLVLVTVSTDDVDAASVSSDGGASQAASVDVTFNQSTWALEQTIRVTGVEDDDARHEDQEISFVVAGAEYDGLVLSPIEVSVVDDDGPGVTVSSPTLAMDEGASNSFTLKLNTEPLGDVTVSVFTDDLAAASVSIDDGATQAGTVDVTFDQSNWMSERAVTVTGVDDADARDERPTIDFVVSGADSDYAGVAVTPVIVSVTDTHEAGLMVSKDSLAMDEGASDSFTVELTSEPFEDVTVTVSTDDVGLASLSSDGGTTQVASLNLTFDQSDWMSAQTVTVTGVGDADAISDTTEISFGVTSADVDYAGVTSEALIAAVTDTDTAGITVSKDSLAMDEGASDSFTVELTSEPSGDVTVTVSTDDVGLASLSSDGGTTQVASLNLIFDQSNWMSAQTVTVTGVSDADAISETAEISFGVTSADEAYAGVTLEALIASVIDPDTAGVTVSEGSLAMDEGGNDSFTVKLNSEPSGEVTVTVSTDDVDAASVSSDGGATQSQSVALTFTTTNWELEQTVTVTGVGDDDTNDETPTISFLITGADYEGIEVASVGASVTDTSLEALTISKESLAITEGGSDTFTLVLDSLPSGDVTVRIALGDGDPASLAKEGEETQAAAAVELIFTTADWNAPQTVRVAATDNATIGDGAATLTLTTSDSVDPVYGALDVPNIAVSIEDDETAAPVPSLSTLSIDEGAAATFTVALGGAPSDQVTITLGTSDASVLTVAESSLIFDATNWDVGQAVALSALENTRVEDLTAEVSLVASGAEFAGSSAKVQVLIIDNDRQVPAQDTGALVSSIATSEVMGSQLGDLISDAVRAGTAATSAAAAGTTKNEAPLQAPRSIFGLSSADSDVKAYNRLHVMSAREGPGGFTLVDWFSVGLSQASLDASLSGDGAYAYALAGRELTKGQGRVSGLLYGVETSTWDYEEETDVDRTGFSLGYYEAQKRDGLTFSGSAIFTLSQNDFVSASGATGDATSQRWIFRGTISGEHVLGDRRGLLRPYVNLMFATEDLAAFSFSDGTTSDASTAQLGRLGLGMEYATLPNASGNGFLVRGELGQVFGTEAITLSDGEVYSPNEDLIGSVTFGWLTQPGTDTSARIELTFGELGNSEREEIRLDGTIDRQF